MNDQMSYSDLLDADDLFEDVDWYDEFGENLELFGDEDLVDDFDEDLDDLMAEMFDSLSPAESFNLGKALGTIGSGAAQVLGDPTVRQIAATAAPVALGAAGTAFGGPVGTAVGATAGQAVGKALAPKPAPAPQAPVAATPVAPMVSPPAPAKPAAATGSAAATKALVLSQQPDVLKSLLALALGEKGRGAVNGIPIGAVMSMLASIYGKAAEDADELLYSSEGAPAYLFDADGHLTADPAVPSERADALYAALIGAENEYLTEAGLA